ncbi:HalOD1 output domain-containing protein [Natrarchaeobius sp. A-rgal3]|uniref:HalOD1 output domain-containing protein n=1 Tax=Natrarchaeobius versutus TaxID=1679078 RepID=UPI00350F860A
MGPGESTSVKIAKKVAAHDGTSPSDLEPPLYAAVDTDALDALFRPSTTRGSDLCLEFTYRGYTISVTAPQEVEVEPRRSSAESPSD